MNNKKKKLLLILGVLTCLVVLLLSRTGKLESANGHIGSINIVQHVIIHPQQILTKVNNILRTL